MENNLPWKLQPTRDGKLWKNTSCTQNSNGRRIQRPPHISLLNSSQNASRYATRRQINSADGSIVAYTPSGSKLQLRLFRQEATKTRTMLGPTYPCKKALQGERWKTINPCLYSSLSRGKKWIYGHVVRNTEQQQKRESWPNLESRPALDHPLIIIQMVFNDRELMKVCFIKSIIRKRNS